MAIYLCHEQPDLLEFDAEVVDSRPGAVLLSRSALHPGGGGQVSDAGTVEHAGGLAQITGISQEDGAYWHLLDGDAELSGPVSVVVDAARRASVSQLHTDSHILNALVYERFSGALVTGAQINADGTARMDFDLPEVDNDLLRALDVEVNRIIAAEVEVRASYVDATEAADTTGLIRSMSVAPPPTPDGRIRIIDIAGVDRQACGGTHLSNTGQSRPIAITKVENKGRHNRRVRFAFAG
jgi:misacylated tRNA(Ala) deacylase